MKEALLRMLSSMKVWTAIIGGLVTAGGSWLAKHQLEVSDTAIQQFAATCALIVGILIHAQGKADAGKVAAQITADADMERLVKFAPPTLSAAVNSAAPGPALVPDPAPEVKS